MPDTTGFNIFPGGEVACIEEGCPARGKTWEWTPQARARHHQQHERDRAAAAQSAARRRARQARLLAAQVARENAAAYGEEARR